MDVPYYQVNAFTRDFNGGNPAGVCPLQNWLPDNLMQAIAKENNLSETAFFVNNGDDFDLRWFTPSMEVDLCGHATLASAHVLFSEMDYRGEKIIFKTKSGPLIVSKNDTGYVMDMPLIGKTESSAPDNLINGLGQEPVEVYKSDDYMLVYDDADFIRNLQPDFALVQNIDLRGTIVTAATDEEGVDFVSRFFGSKAIGIKEDPATGSAHCMLAPYWGSRLQKSELVARQVSPRGADIICKINADKILVSGQAVIYIKGRLYIE